MRKEKGLAKLEKSLEGIRLLLITWVKLVTELTVGSYFVSRDPSLN